MSITFGILLQVYINIIRGPKKADTASSLQCMDCELNWFPALKEVITSVGRLLETAPNRVVLRVHNHVSKQIKYPVLIYITTEKSVNSSPVLSWNPMVLWGIWNNQSWQFSDCNFVFPPSTQNQWFFDFEKVWNIWSQCFFNFFKYLELVVIKKEPPHTGDYQCWVGDHKQELTPDTYRGGPLGS